MKTIFITSFHVLVSRNILQAPFLKLILDAGWRVVLVVPKKKEEFFKNNFSHQNIVVAGIENKLNRLDDIFKDLALAALRTKSLRTMRQRRMGIERPLSQRIFFFAPLIKSLIPLLYKVVMPAHSFGTLFEDHKPDVVFSTDVFSATDCRLLVEARSRGVKTIGMVRSWDNLTSKGGFRVVPDVLVTQNMIVLEEAVRLHGIKKEIIQIVGIPHYDNYVQTPAITREEFLKTLDIPKEGRYFVYAPLGDRIMKVGDVVHEHGYDNEMVAILDANLPKDTYLVVRFPPTDTVTIDRSKLSSRIKFSSPGIRFGEGVKGVRSSEMSREDDESLFHTLYFSNGVINPFSSLCVDSVFLDRPVIVPCFDPKQVSYWESVTRLQEFNHFQPIVDNSGVRVAKNENDLKSFLELYSKDMHADSNERLKLAELECFSRDGKSSERLLKIIQDSVRD